MRALIGRAIWWFVTAAIEAEARKAQSDYDPHRVRVVPLGMQGVRAKPTLYEQVIALAAAETRPSGITKTLDALHSG